METRLGAVEVAFLEALEAHHDVTAIAALRAAESGAVIVVVVIDHQADAYAFERIEDLAQRAAQYVEEGIGPCRAHKPLRNKRIAGCAAASR